MSPEAHRQTCVRVILRDDEGRVLLLLGRDPETGAQLWFPTGGRVEGGEHLAAAVRREVAEETGLGGIEVGEVAWRTRRSFDWNGETRDVDEHWFVVSVEHFEPSFDDMTADERTYVQVHRWWTLAELRSTKESVTPEDLVARLAGSA